MKQKIKILIVVFSDFHAVNISFMVNFKLSVEHTKTGIGKSNE